MIHSEEGLTVLNSHETAATDHHNKEDSTLKEDSHAEFEIVGGGGQSTKRPPIKMRETI